MHRRLLRSFVGLLQFFQELFFFIRQRTWEILWTKNQLYFLRQNSHTTNCIQSYLSLSFVSDTCSDSKPCASAHDLLVKLIQQNVTESTLPRTQIMISGSEFQSFPDKLCRKGSPRIILLRIIYQATGILKRRITNTNFAVIR